MYEHIAIIRDYIKERRLLEEFAGMILKSLCTGPAKTLIDEAFTIERNPERSSISSLLIKNFGNIKNILIGLCSEHEKLGKITADYREEIEMNFKRITRHCKLVEAAVIVFKRSCSPDARIEDYWFKVCTYLTVVDQMEANKRCPGQERTGQLLSWQFFK